MITYDEQRLRDEFERDAAGAITGYDFDPIARLEVLTHDLGGTSHDAGFGFQYNPASQITFRGQTNDSYEAPFVSSVKSYVTNGRNQYTQVGGTTHGWDTNGNLTSDGLTTFGYDTENRLVSASGAKNASLAYDPLGRLYQVTSGSTTTRFVYDGDRLIAEYVGSALQRRYVHGAGVDEPLLWYEGSAVSSATRRYLHADHQGSIVAASNPSGALISGQKHSYDAYGVNGTPNSLRFQYTGQAAIPEVGLLYYKARFYNPALGRFMQTDPIGYEDDLNLYAYVYNDPLNNTDPTGMCEPKTGTRICEIHGKPQKTATQVHDTASTVGESITASTVGESILDYAREHLRVGWIVSASVGKGGLSAIGFTIDLGSARISDEISSEWTPDGKIHHYSEGRTKTELGVVGIGSVSTENTTTDNGKTWIRHPTQYNKGPVLQILQNIFADTDEPVTIDVSIGLGIVYEDTFILD